MNLVESLFNCTTPVQTARVFNPTRPEYYRAEEPLPAEPAVKVTLSPEAQATLKGE